MIICADSLGARSTSFRGILFLDLFFDLKLGKLAYGAPDIRKVPREPYSSNRRFFADNDSRLVKEITEMSSETTASAVRTIDQTPRCGNATKGS